MLHKRKCMSFDDFCSYFRSLLQQKIGTGYEVSVKEIPNNNHCTLTGLVIGVQGRGLCPVIYLDNYYEEYISGRYSLAEVAKAVTYLCDLHMDSGNHDAYLYDWNSAKEKLMYGVVNYKYNKEILKHVPYKKFLDLAIVFYLYFGKGRTVLVDEDCLKNWKINLTEENLFEIAHYNTQRILGFTIESMETIMKQMNSMDEDWRLISHEGMYVLSNQTGEYGASVMLYEELLGCFSDETGGRDLYILPSSIHELIIIPIFESTTSLYNLMKIVRGINTSILSQEEILSDHVYKYSRETKQITIVI